MNWSRRVDWIQWCGKKIIIKNILVSVGLAPTEKIIFHKSKNSSPSTNSYLYLDLCKGFFITLHLFRLRSYWISWTWRINYLFISCDTQLRSSYSCMNTKSNLNFRSRKKSDRYTTAWVHFVDIFVHHGCSFAPIQIFNVFLLYEDAKENIESTCGSVKKNHIRGRRRQSLMFLWDKKVR